MVGVWYEVFILMRGRRTRPRLLPCTSLFRSLLQTEKSPAPCGPDSAMRRLESPTTPTRSSSPRAQSKGLGTPKRYTHTHTKSYTNTQTHTGTHTAEPCGTVDSKGDPLSPWFPGSGPPKAVPSLPAPPASTRPPPSVRGRPPRFAMATRTGVTPRAKVMEPWIRRSLNPPAETLEQVRM